MPITQDRMIALIDAADAVLELCKHRERLATAIYNDDIERGRIAQAREICGRTNALSAAQLYEDVIAALLAALNDHSKLPQELWEVIVEEKKHFKYTRKRNETARKATRAWRKRRESESYGNERTLFNPTGAHEPMRLGAGESAPSLSDSAFIGPSATPNPLLSSTSATSNDDIVVENGVEYLVLDDGSRIRVLK